MDDLAGKMQELLSDPESMQQLSELAAMLQSGDAPQETASVPQAAAQNASGFDPMLLMRLSELMRTQQTPDRNTTLLLALKPYLGERRQYRTEKAVKLLRLYSLWKVAKQSGMLNDLI